MRNSIVPLSLSVLLACGGTVFAQKGDASPDAQKLPDTGVHEDASKHRSKASSAEGGGIENHGPVGSKSGPKQVPPEPPSKH